MVARICGILKHSWVNGPGARFVVFFQGCPHHCPGCQNPDTHAIDGGTEITTEDIINQIYRTKLLDGITLSGGDPLFQAGAAMEIAKAAKEMGLSVWAYTGWQYEDVLSEKVSQEAKDLLNYLDVLVDGPFKQELLSDACVFRGSTNQRLVDVQTSLKNKTTTNYTY